MIEKKINACFFFLNQFVDPEDHRVGQETWCVFVYYYTGPDAQLFSRGGTQRPLLSGHHLQPGLAGGEHNGLRGFSVPLWGHRQLNIWNVSALEQWHATQHSPQHTSDDLHGAQDAVPWTHAVWPGSPSSSPSPPSSPPWAASYPSSWTTIILLLWTLPC